MTAKQGGTFVLIGKERSKVIFGAAVLFLLVAVNTLIKIVRDSVFLGHHEVAELPYLYLLVALFAGTLIAIYSKYTQGVSLMALLLGSYAVIIGSLVGFWILLAYYDPPWSHYAFYIWSALAAVIAIAQAWTFLGTWFEPSDGQRLFGFVTAGGTLGGLSAALTSHWLLSRSFDVLDLLWIAVVLMVMVAALIFFAKGRADLSHSAEDGSHDSVQGLAPATILARSPYLQSIAALIFVSVIVSTLIDFEFKAAAKVAYPSKDALAGYFSRYYGWLNGATFVAQFLLTARLFSFFGFIPSLYLTPGILFAGLTAMSVWPGLVVASITRIAETVLRNSLHRSGTEILYLTVPGDIRKSVKTFLDVVVERLGDATAGFVMLVVVWWSADATVSHVHYLCLALTLGWMVSIRVLGKHRSQMVAVTEKDQSIRVIIDENRRQKLHL